jgi:enoyl-CoA hydratase
MADPAPDQTDEVILAHRAGPVRFITLNRPDRLNALSRPMLLALDRAFAAARNDEETRVVVLRGAGRAFSTGFDITQGGFTPGTDPDPVRDRDNIQAHIDRWLSVWDFPKPVIAQVHGYCLAAATQLVAVSDLAIAADNAVFGSPVLSLGGGFISPMWLHLVGTKRAKEMSFVAGNQISGTEASMWGFVNRAVPADELADEVRLLAARVSQTPASLLRLKKHALNRATELAGFRTVLGLAPETNAMLHYSAEVHATRASVRENGLRSTMQRRKDEAHELAKLSEEPIDE